MALFPPLSYIVKAAPKRAGINSAVSAHWLRHAHASHAIDAGAPITLVSQTLGHADLKTTSVYAHGIRKARLERLPDTVKQHEVRIVRSP